MKENPIWQLSTSVEIDVIVAVFPSVDQKQSSQDLQKLAIYIACMQWLNLTCLPAYD